MVSSGAPESSNWPPGSRLTLQPPLGRARSALPFSSTGSQPNRVIQALQQRPDAARPVIGQRPQVAGAKPNFSCSVPMRHSDAGLLPCSRWLTRLRGSVIGSPRDFGGADMDA